MTEFSEIDIKQVKSYWNNRPCNIRHSQKTIGSKEYFDEVEARKYFVEPHLPLFADFPSMNAKHVLEIGCGLGTTTVGFAKAGAKITAVDLSEHSLSLAKTRAEVYGLQDNIEFYTANVEELSQAIPRKEYDLIFSFGVLHHTPNPERAFMELMPFLKPGGQLKIMVYYRYSWKVLGILLKYGKGRFWQLKKLIAKYSEAQTGCPVTYTYTKKEIKKIIQSHGLDIENIEINHIFPYQIKQYVNYHYVKEWYFRIMPKFIFARLERLIGWHLCLTATKPFKDHNE